MAESPAWISAREAAARLDVKLATLYAYASRGLLESVPAPDGRGRRYAHDAVERLKARHDARAGHAAVAAAALRFGEPTLETSVSEIRSDGPYYRGQSALQLADGRTTFEAVSELLWGGQLGVSTWPGHKPYVLAPLLQRRSKASTSIAALAATVSCAALTDTTRHAASDPEEQARARRLIQWLAQQVGRAPSASATSSCAERILRSLRARPSDAAIALVDRALILCADHELNPSTFAARVTASTGADLYACLAAALHTLSGPLHGGASVRVEAVVAQLPSASAAARLVRERHARGERIAGFGHPLYPEGDPRAPALLELAELALSSSSSRTPPPRQRVESLARLRALTTAMRSAQHGGPNLDLGLVALCSALGLPAGSAAALFAIARSSGWVAHALEQRRQGYLLRPRSRYVPR
ncbi:MAG: Citrate synthase [Myxococcaceae bacterium]|nr:Citrate synthase [Myxococcaceae bacterium]